MSKSVISSSPERIESRIFTVRGLQVMLDRDLAELYQVPVKALNQAVKRNIDRFPPDFCFQLGKDEFEGLVLKSQIVTSNSGQTASGESTAFILKSQIVTSRSHGGIRKMPYAFTEQGVSMLSAVLRSDIAVKISVQIIRVFIAMRKTLTQIGGVIQRVENVKAILLTKNISNQLKLDIEKFNQQYPAAEVRAFGASHDRFLIIDGKEVYHLGASLKDLGKKWFAFSKMGLGGFALLEKVKKEVKIA